MATTSSKTAKQVHQVAHGNSEDEDEVVSQTYQSIQKKLKMSSAAEGAEGM